MSKPLISLIIPMHNAERFIAKCLDSALSQTYDNTEVIIVDDNSTDGSVSIAKSYAEKHESIFYMRVSNGNAARTRRDGLEKSNAELVCFLDADDILNEKYVEYLYEAMEKENTQISACNIDMFSNEDELKQNISNHPKFYRIDSSASSFADHYHITDTNKLTLQTLPCKLFEKNLFDNIDYEVLRANIFEDNFIMVQILRKVKEIAVVDETLYWYRQATGTTSGGTITTKVDLEGRQLNFVEFFRDVVMEYCRKAFDGPDVDAAIDRLSAAEFYSYARMVPDLKTHNEYLEQKISLEEERLKDRDNKIESILRSRSYRLGNAIVEPMSRLKNIFKKRR